MKRNVNYPTENGMTHPIYVYGYFTPLVHTLHATTPSQK